MPWKTLGKVCFARVGVGLILNTIGQVVLDDYQTTFAVSRQRHPLLDPHHLGIGRHIASFLSMDDLTVWALDIHLTWLMLHHLDKTVSVELMTTSGQEDESSQRQFVQTDGANIFWITLISVNRMETDSLRCRVSLVDGGG